MKKLIQRIHTKMNNDVFNSWPLTKAISHKEKMFKVAELLANKTASDITFSAMDEVGDIDKYVLGSVEGNLKFLLGYVNPGFYYAPYHLQIMDPGLTDEEAALIYETKGHPSIPELWNINGVPPFAEGDLAEGKPAVDVAKKNNLFKFKFNGKSYVADPDSQLITCKSTGRIYAWSLVKNTYLASQVPKLLEKMEPEQTPVVKALPYPAELWQVVDLMKGEEYADNVYPLVKSSFPKPGSIIKLKNDGYAVFWSNQVSLYDKDGNTSPVRMWDRVDEDGVIDLTKGSAELFPCVILNFASKYLGLDLSSLEESVNG